MKKFQLRVIVYETSHTGVQRQVLLAHNCVQNLRLAVVILLS